MTLSEYDKLCQENLKIEIDSAKQNTTYNNVVIDIQVLVNNWLNNYSIMCKRTPHCVSVEYINDMLNDLVKQLEYYFE